MAPRTYTIRRQHSRFIQQQEAISRENENIMEINPYEPPKSNLFVNENKKSLKDRINERYGTMGKRNPYRDIAFIFSAPPRALVNGIGMSTFGKSDKDDELGIYTTGYYFTLFFLPVFPIKRYCVAKTSSDERLFIGELPLNFLDKIHGALFLIAITAAFICFAP